MNHKISLFLILLGTQGCAQYFSVQEACDEKVKVPGGSFLLPDDEEGTWRINCYRKLTGVAKQHAAQLVQQAARDELDYIDQNPEAQNLFGKLRERAFLNQTVDAPGYTGLELYQRLTDPVTGTGYVFYDLAATETREYVKILVDNGEGTPSGADAVDWLMRDPEFRQLALQPSFIDGAYAEKELPAEWFTDGNFAGIFPDQELPVGGRAYYLVSMFTKPHQEHVAKPVQLPKADQTDVPLYSWSHEVVQDGQVSQAQIGYAMTFQVGALDTSIYKETNQNQYSAGISDVTITGPEGALTPIVVVPDVTYPASEDGKVTPDGVWLRNTIAVYTWEFLQPSSTYDVTVRLATEETDWDLDFSFTTVDADPGLNEMLQMGGTVVTGTTN
ncbi:MAG: hypothetical protein H6735_26410 [Alphaproteobacteria bacterium]|nr:hypothetical protein [Alphaproteobacteria bacterium]